MEPNDYLKELAAALREYRFRDIRALTGQINPNDFEIPQIRKTLGLIRRKRLFPELEHAASLFHMTGKNAPVIRRQWSQALLDQDKVSQALTALEPMSKDFGSDPVEGPEIRGLIGRAYKQLYIKNGGAVNLRSAISAYMADWEHRRGDYRWQGINLVALLSRAKHDNVDSGTALEPVSIAKDILDDIDERGVSGSWDYATAMEAAVALGDHEAALAWAKKYVQHPDADAFELASTLRQLKEVWSLEGSDIGNKLLPVLECVLLQREGGTVQPMRFDRITDQTGFEAIWGSESYVYVQWFDTLYGCCNSIARISNSATGEPKGTGFLVPGYRLYPSWGEAPVFLTNAHVISTNPIDKAPLRPEEAVAEFTRLPARPKISIGKLLFSSCCLELDVSICRIEAPEGSKMLESNDDLPQVSSDSVEPQRIYVIGHPGGAELAVSLYNNSLVEYDKHYVRYRSPTESGHSGSPVLTRQLKAFAVHHAARYDRQLNEGIVLNAVRTALQGTPPSG